MARRHGLLTAVSRPYAPLVGPTILLCCTADAALTAAIVSKGGTEANPIMAGLVAHPAGWALKVAVPLAIWVLLPHTTSRWLHHAAYLVAVVYAGIVGWGLAVLAHT